MSELARSTALLEPPAAVAEADERAGRRLGGWVGQFGFGAAMTIGLASPALFSSRPFASDFTNDLWYIGTRAQAVEWGNWLSPFLHAYGIGIFSPLPAFYSGPLFSAIGALGDVLSNVLLACNLSILAAFAMAYGGLYWIARQCGVRPSLAHVPPIAVLTSAYWITVGYGRGDISELFGLCSACLVAASAAALVRADRSRFLPALVLVGSSAVFCGSHNITLVWASVVGVVIALGLVVVFRPALAPSRVLGTIGLLALGAALDAWSLLPDLAYANQPNVARLDEAQQVASTTFFDTFSVLFDPLRMVPSASTTPGLFVQAPDAFLAFGLVGLAVLCVRRRDPVARRAGLVLLVVLAGLCSLVLDNATAGLPLHLSEIQFPYRLDSYVALLVGGLALVVVARAPSLQRRRWWRTPAGAALVGLGAFSVALAAWQLWVPNDAQAAPPTGGSHSLPTRADALSDLEVPPASYYAYDDYGDDSANPVPTLPGRTLYFSAAYLHPGQTEVTYDLNVPSGFAPIDTNIAASPAFLSISGGVERVGVDRSGYAVIARAAAATGPVLVVLQEAGSAPLVLGRRATVVGGLVSLTVLGALAARDLLELRRRRGRARGAQGR